MDLVAKQFSDIFNNFQEKSILAFPPTTWRMKIMFEKKKKKQTYELSKKRLDTLEREQVNRSMIFFNKFKFKFKSTIFHCHWYDNRNCVPFRLFYSLITGVQNIVHVKHIWKAHMQICTQYTYNIWKIWITVLTCTSLFIFRTRTIYEKYMNYLVF